MCNKWHSNQKSEILEQVGKVNTIVFDKTGTLTYGKLKISKLYNYSELSDKELLKITGSIERLSNHPIASAFNSYMEDENIKTFDVDSFKNLTGLGIKAKIKSDEYILGNAKILAKYKIKNDYLKDEEELIKSGNSLVYVIKNKKIIGLIGVSDIIRDDVINVIKELKEKILKQ